MKDLDPRARITERAITRVREEVARAERPVRMPRTVLAASVLLALALGACERGHYATRDHVVSDESAGAERGAAAQTQSTSETDASAQRTERAESTEGASREGTEGASAEGTEGASAESTEGASAEGIEAQTHDAAASDDGTRGHAPEEEMARARVQAAQAVTIRVHTTSGPITRAVADRALSMQRMRIDHCFRTTAGPQAGGSMRASIHVEASGAARVELETMTPELDRVLPCVDAALERTPFPATSDGRPTHVVAEIARTP